jgi:tetratricopeptide (TPR) repeat protein
MSTKKGLAFHCHHNTLVDFVYDLAERQQSIRDNKPGEEIPLRLRLLQIIPKGRLPQEGLDEYIKAQTIYEKVLRFLWKAMEAFAKAEADYFEAYKNYHRGAFYEASENEASENYRKAYEASENYRKAYEAYYYKAKQDYWDAREPFYKALKAYYQKNEVAFKKLHEELCPDCPWNGKTIFTRKDANGNWY